MRVYAYYDVIENLFARVFLRELLTFVTGHVTAPVKLAVTLPTAHVLVSVVAPATA